LAAAGADDLRATIAMAGPPWFAARLQRREVAIFQTSDFIDS